jgi:hypothetical protein
MPLQRLLAALRGAAGPAPLPLPLPASAHTFPKAALLHALAAHRDLAALMLSTHPHLTLEARPGFGRCTFAACALPAGATVLREAAFASVELHEGTRGCDTALLDTLRVYVGDGTPAAALPYYVQQEPNLAALEAGCAPATTSALALFAPALHRNSFVVGSGLLLSVLLASLTNHSCLPNVSVASGQGAAGAPELVFTALRPIAQGEEISLSYIDCDQSFAARRERLAATYSFHCTCARCRAEALLDPSPCTCAACTAEAPSSAFF